MSCPRKAARPVSTRTSRRWPSGRVTSDRPVKPGDDKRRRRRSPILHHGDVGGVFVLHADNVVAGVDMQDLAGDAAPEIGQGDRARPRRCPRSHTVRLSGRVVLVPFEDVAKVGDARGGERLDRPGRDGVDADRSLAEIGGEIADALPRARPWPRPSRRNAASPSRRRKGEGEERAALPHQGSARFASAVKE